ncbi:hypothetical protein PoB_004552600 [Plakobranchus ocellatus]|uniref:Uncharacterized protein n=1 Tax=Plakobranchus ocellatus TaxID=259542 RepID=A0AAV4BJB5_9GAST|nr:hypothetical protein PoB_004552600 [Plakobranchus ocellatus]
MLPNDIPQMAMSVGDDHIEDTVDIADGDTLQATSSDGIVKKASIPESKSGESDAISVISEANSLKSSKSKKRVQFLPEGLMVRVREIPPRSYKSSSESDGSASETSSDSEGSDTESEDTSSGSRTPSPAHTVSETTFTTMPPLVWNPSIAAKGSYTVAKQSSKVVNTVAKITGIHHRSISPASSSSASTKNSPRRLRRTPSPKLEKRVKKSSPKVTEKTTVSVSVKSLDPPQKSKILRKSPQTRKDGKISPPANLQKQNNKSKQSVVNNTSNSFKLSATATKMTLAQRRINSAPSAKPVTPKRNGQSPAVSTSVTILPSQQHTNQQHVISKTSMDKVGRAMQSLTMGQLYTIDGFIFPSHQSPEVHLPDVLTPYKSDDLGLAQTSRLSSPRRSLDFGSISLYHSHSQQGQTSPTSANRKKRHAWQMAEGGAQSTLNNTPSIAQLWDHVHSGSSHDTADGSRTISNGFNHRT